MNRSIFVPIVLLILNRVSHCQDTRLAIQIINKVQFPYGGPFMGLFLAIAMPLEIPEPEVFVSYNFEANYLLPENQTTFQYPPIVSNAMEVARRQVYDALEFKLNSHGYTGKACLLRAICEATEYSLQHTGVLADVLHVILTPSTSKSEGLIDYESAEKYGKENKHCKAYERLCPIALDLAHINLCCISFVHAVRVFGVDRATPEYRIEKIAIFGGNFYVEIGFYGSGMWTLSFASSLMRKLA
ncbi:hypothetical protein Trydic_g5133 [Trypoxylus dichotomus]